MEWFAGAGASSPTTTSYVTPVKPSKVNLADLTPPGAPKARSRLSRVELARELLSRTAATTRGFLAAWMSAPEEVAKSVKKAGEGLKRAAQKPAASKPAKAKKPPAAAKKQQPPQPPQPTGVRTRAATAKAAAGAAKAKPKNAQTQAELDAALRGGTGGSSEAAQAAQAAAAKKGKKGAAPDPLVRHGYATQGPIAAGAFSTIVRAKMLSSGLEVAVKSFDNQKCRKDYQHLYLREGELNALRKVKSQGASRWVANLIEEHTGPQYTYAILEYCAGGSLQRHLQKLQKKGRDVAMDEGETRRLGAQVNAALAHLHQLDVAHRDLKPGNVLFYGPDTNHLKLCDFGFAKRCRGQRLHTICGTPIYMSPELTLGESKKGYEGPMVDMWALGCLLYEMLHNKVAFNGVSEMQLFQRIRSGKHTGFKKGIGKEVRTLITSLLEVDPTKRMHADMAAKQKVFANVDSLDSRRGAAVKEVEEPLDA